MTPDQQDASELPVVPWAWFVEMQFASGTVRVCNFNKNFVWNIQTWIGLGSLGRIDEIKASEKIEPNAVRLSLNIAQPQWLALGLGAVEEYRGLPAIIYQCPLDEQHRLIDLPAMAWSGEMDIVTASFEAGGDSALEMRCEPASKRLRRRVPLRVNAVQQRQRYPNDSGLDYLANLLANPQTWLSIRFQTQ